MTEEWICHLQQWRSCFKIWRVRRNCGGYGKLWSYRGVMHISQVIVRLLPTEWFQELNLRLSLAPRQGLTPPVPPWWGLWPTRFGTAWASALPCLPAADIRVTSWAERRSAGDTGEGDSEGGEGNTWPRANLLCTLSQSVTQSLLHTPLPHPYLFIFYTPTHQFHIFSILVHTHVSSHTSLHNSCLHNMHV